jgi:hypothetical protein
MKVMLFVKRPGGKSFEGLGMREFITVPSIGEHIDLTADDPDKNESSMYKVVGFHHPGQPSGKAGDIYAVWVGTQLDLIKELLLDEKK